MRILALLILLFPFAPNLNAQCLHDKIAITFNFECTTGNANGARIGIDSVLHVGTDWGQVSISNNSFTIYKNGIVQNNSVIYGANDIIKIIPVSIGFSNIGVDSDEPGCVINWGSDRYVCLTTPMPIIYQYQPSVKLQDNQTQFTWSVATQLNNEKYIIKHSTDCRNFSPIGEIAGDGTSNATKHYEYIHTSPSIGINYYRIKQVDYDGKYSYSDIVSVRYDGNGATIIYPNPATSEVTITTSETTTLQIMDVYGKLYKQQDIQEGQNTINLSELPSGILIFVVGDRRFKVLKE